MKDVMAIGDNLNDLSMLESWLSSCDGKWCRRS